MARWLDGSMARWLDGVWTSEEERAFALAMRRFGADLWTIQRRVLPMKSLPQVVDFYYSEKGQKIEAALEAERLAAEKVRPPPDLLD
eukprot:588566-Prymnesium_polylepis.1